MGLEVRFVQIEFSTVFALYALGQEVDGLDMGVEVALLSELKVTE